MGSSYAMLNRLQFNMLRNATRPPEVLGEQFESLFKGIVTAAGINRTAEIGAYEASFSSWARSALPGLRSVTAYEANPYVWRHFEAGLRQGGVDYRNLAVGPENGNITLRLPRDFRGTPQDQVNQIGSLMANTQAENVEPVTVPSVRLDSDQSPAGDDVFALWIDVEGATEIVLAGAAETLKRTAIIHIEVESQPIWQGQWLDSDVARFLESRGFQPLTRDLAKGNQYNMIYANPALCDADQFAIYAVNFLLGLGRFSAG